MNPGDSNRTVDPEVPVPIPEPDTPVHILNTGVPVWTSDSGFSDWMTTPSRTRTQRPRLDRDLNRTTKPDSTTQISDFGVPDRPSNPDVPYQVVVPNDLTRTWDSGDLIRTLELGTPDRTSETNRTVCYPDLGPKFP